MAISKSNVLFMWLYVILGLNKMAIVKVRNSQHMVMFIL